MRACSYMGVPLAFLAITDIGTRYLYCENWHNVLF